MRTKFFLGLFLAASSSSIFAMPYDTIKHPGTLEIALTGGGYKASTDNTAYGILGTMTIFGVGAIPTGDVLKNSPEYKFGGSVLVGYYFPDSSLNVDISYFGARNNTDDFNLGVISPTLLPPAYLIAIGVADPHAAAAADSSFHFRYDYANIEVGSLTRVTCNGLIINPQLGLSFARLKGSQFASYTGGNLPVNFAGVAELDSSFKGFGPSIGFDLNYIFCQPVTLMSNFRYNALVGSVNSDYAFGGLTNAPIISSVSNTSNETLVSLIQAEIALGYDFSWTTAFSGNIAIGYQLTKAIGSAESWNYPNDVDASFFTSSMLNASLHGYFVRFTIDLPV